MDRKNELAQDGIEVAQLVKELVHLLKATMAKAFEGSGLTPTQGMVVGNLHRLGNLKVSELGTLLGLSNSTMSGILDRLEKMNIVVRTRSEEDKRVVYVSLSPNYECTHSDFHKKTGRIIQEIMEKGSEEEIKKVLEGLRIFKELLNR